MNAGTTGLVFRDRLYARQLFCMIANTIWGLGIWVEPSEPVLGIPEVDPTVDGNADLGGEEDDSNDV
jgi:hypothetical protein